MNKLKNYLKGILLFFIMFFIYLILISTFYYFEIISYKVVNIMNYIFMLIIFFILGFKVSSLEKKKGYLNGFLVSMLLIILFVILSAIIAEIKFSSLVYYLSLISSSITGGIIGISKK